MPQEIILRSNKPPLEAPCDTVGQYIWMKLGQLDDDFVCVIEVRTGQKLTIGRLKREANNIAVALLKRGISKSDVITFYGPNTIEHTILRFSIFFLGLTFMPLSPTFEKYEVEEEYKSAGANIIISSTGDLHKFNGIIEDSLNNNETNLKLVVVFDGKDDRFVSFEQLLEEGRGQSLEQIPHFEVNTEKDMLFLIHTSGSTGRPKCAMIPHKLFLLSGEEMLTFSGSMRGSIIGMVYPFGHISGTTMIPMQIIGGATVILLGDFDEELLMKSVEKYRINFMPLFPNIGRRFIEGTLADKYDLSSLKVMSTGGASFPGNIAKAIIEKYGIKFREAYGMTECLLVTCGPQSDEPFIPGNAGKVATGVQVKFTDLTTGQSLGPNIDGEICVKGNKMFCGYLKEGKVSLEAFDSEGWYRTGDIGHYDEKERIFITDRLKEVVRIGVDNHYINISPVEIELFLLTHKSIAEVAVIGVNNTAKTHWPRAYVVLKEGHTSTEQEIQKFVSETLAYTKQLKGGVVFLNKIQRTSIGKVDRKFYRNLVKDEVIQ